MEELVPSYQRFSSGSVSSGGTSARLTASTNVRKTVRATKEILNVEDEEEDKVQAFAGVLLVVPWGQQDAPTDTKFKTRQLINTALH